VARSRWRESLNSPDNTQASALPDLFMEQALKALAHLSADNKSNIRKLASAGVCTLLLKVMLKFGRVSVTVAEWGSVCAHHLASSNHDVILLGEARKQGGAELLHAYGFTTHQIL
jgi:hypothetical protein